MLKLTKGEKVDLDVYESHLRYRSEVVGDSPMAKHGYIYFDRETFLKVLEYNKVREDSLFWFIYNELITRSGGAYGISSNLRDSIIKYLTGIARVNPSLLRHKTSKSLSVNKKVLLLLIQKGIEPDLLEAYINYTSLKSTNGKREGILNALVPTDLENSLGNKLCKLHYFIDRGPNLRYNAYDEAIISIPKIYNSCITIPKGEYLISADFSQSDFRSFLSVFVINEDNYQHFNNYSDSYEATEVLMCKLEGEVYDREKFLEDRELFKVFALETVYGTKTELNPKGSEFVKRFNKFLDKCPRYVDYKRRLILHKRLGLSPVITDYFGNEQTVDLTSSSFESTPSINRALNAPIQSFTSVALIIVINKILDKFKEFGIGEEDLQLYYPRHDEAIFRGTEKAIPYLWIFKEFERIYIDNFYPLDFEFSMYSQYKVPDESMNLTYKQVCSSNEDRITYVERDNNFDMTYCPVRDVLEIAVTKLKVPHTNNWVITLYYGNLKSADYAMMENVIDSEIDNKIQAFVSLKISEIFDHDVYSGVLVYSSLRVIEEYMANEVYFKWIDYNPIDQSLSLVLSENKLWQYCIREGIDYKPNDTILGQLKNIENINRANLIRV